MRANRNYRLIGLAGLLILVVAGWFTAARADTYLYDALGRLKSVTFSDGSSITYTYDAAGNRTIVQTTSP